MTGSYEAPMLIVGGFMFLSAALAFVVGRSPNEALARAEPSPRTA